MSIVLFDTHCHVQDSKYDADREAVIQRALDAGVGMICVGTDLEMSRKAVALAEKYEGIWASVGLHPNDNLDEVYDQSEYEKLAVHPKVVAIGEVGLDYYRTTDEDKKKFQKERFLKQIELAIQVNKPLIIHCRDAHADMTEILATNHLPAGQAGSSLTTSLRGVIHSFTGTYNEARRYIELGFSSGVNGIITFAKQYDETIINLPVDKLLLETDAPYLSPVPYRGQRNEPMHVLEVAKKVAELRGISLEDIMRKTYDNTQKLFKL